MNTLVTLLVCIRTNQVTVCLWFTVLAFTIKKEFEDERQKAMTANIIAGSLREPNACIICRT